MCTSDGRSRGLQAEVSRRSWNGCEQGTARMIEKQKVSIHRVASTANRSGDLARDCNSVMYRYDPLFLKHNPGPILSNPAFTWPVPHRVGGRNILVRSWAVKNARYCQQLNPGGWNGCESVPVLRFHGEHIPLPNHRLQLLTFGYAVNVPDGTAVPRWDCCNVTVSDMCTIRWSTCTDF